MTRGDTPSSLARILSLRISLRRLHPRYIDKNAPGAELRGRVFEQDECGRGERTRTFDLTVPNRAR